MLLFNPTPSQDEGDCDCEDVVAGDETPCWLMKASGGCQKGGGYYCARTCGYCQCLNTCFCTDITPPTENASCSQLVIEGRCTDVQDYYCQQSCMRCGCNSTSNIVNLPPYKLHPLVISPIDQLPYDEIVFEASIYEPPVQKPEQLTIYVQNSANEDKNQSFLNVVQGPQIERREISNIVGKANAMNGTHIQGIQDVSEADEYDESISLTGIASILGQLEEALSFESSLVSLQYDQEQSQDVALYNPSCVSDILKQLSCCEMMMNAVTRTGLAFALDDPLADYTVFVPSDKAFQRAIEYGLNVSFEMTQEDDTLLTELLGFHILPSAVTVNSLRKQQQWRTLFDKQEITVENTTDQRVTLYGGIGVPARIVKADILSEFTYCNSIVHTIDQVLIQQHFLPAVNPVTIVPVSIMQRSITASPSSILIQRLRQVSDLSYPEQSSNSSSTNFFNIQNKLEIVNTDCSKTNNFTIDDFENLLHNSPVSEFWNITKNLLSKNYFVEIKQIIEESWGKNLTLFFPINSVIQQYNINFYSQRIIDVELQVEIDNFLLQHFVIGDILEEQDVINGQAAQQNLQTIDVGYRYNSSLIFQPGIPFGYVINQQGVVANIVQANILNDKDMGCNIAVHALDGVLAEQQFLQKIFEVSGKISYVKQDLQNAVVQQHKCVHNVTLIDTLKQSNSLEYAAQFFQYWASPSLLQERGQLTLFLPIPSQIGKLLELAQNLRSAMEKNDDIMQTLLDYHIVLETKINITQIKNLGRKQRYYTRAGLPIFIGPNLDNKVVINATGSSAIVVEENIVQASCNIAIYLVSDILQPVVDVQQYQTQRNSTVQSGQELMQILESQSEDCRGGNVVLPMQVENATLCLQKFKDLFAKYRLPNNTSNITIFMPDNEACATLDEILLARNSNCEKKRLEEEILAYHIVKDTRLNEETLQRLNTQQYYLSTFLVGSKVSLAMDSGNIVVKGISGSGIVSKQNIQQQCGMLSIHVIDNILIPFQIDILKKQDCLQSPMDLIVNNKISVVARSVDNSVGTLQKISQSPLLNQSLSSFNNCTPKCCSVFKIIKQHENLKTFMQLILELNLTQYLNTQMDLTVFVPNDNGFQQYFQQVGINSIRELQQQQMHALVYYHIVEGVWPTTLMKPKNFKMRTKLKSKDQGNVYLSVTQHTNNQIFLKNQNWIIVGNTNNVSIMEKNLEACSAIVHVIDTPLIYDSNG